MADLQTRIFIGADHHDATAQLSAAITDGSFPVLSMTQTSPLMWITHCPAVFPGGMQAPSYQLHVTAWVKVDPVDVPLDAIENEAR